MGFNPVLLLFLTGALANVLLENRDAPRNISYELASTIPWSPLNATSVDQSTIYNGTYYLADRSNNAVHVVDVGANKQKAAIFGFQGLTSDHATSGPNGLLVLPHRNELYVGDGDGSVKVINLFTYDIVANISTGSKKRADEMAYDPKTDTVVVTSPNDIPPKTTIISATDRKVLGHVIFNNASGLEQPAWNSADGLFYISVPKTGANPGGEIAVLDASAMNISKVLPLATCNPAGIVFGPDQNLFIGCSQDQILTYGVSFSQVINVTSGGLVAKISGLAGIDQVTYDPNAMLYFASAYQNLAGASESGAPMPQLGIIDAKSNTLVQTLATDNATAHSVAVDMDTNQIVVPLKKYGIEVYNLTIASTTSQNSSTSGGATTNAGVTNIDYQAITFIGGLLIVGILVW